MNTREIAIGNNTLRFETGKLAKQAGGSVIVRFGDSVVLVTACRAGSAREGIDFLPLTVDYREYTYASGRILQTRRQAGREGSAHEPLHRSADSAAVPIGLAL
jgi:polyribonucleotide nucleotidyltransferase